LIVAGVMSGTSADGINVALVRLGSPPAAGHRFTLIGQAEYPYRKEVRKTILAAMNAANARVADLSRLNFLLGELYAAAVLSAQRRFRVRADLVGCHGQTLYHQGEPALFLGRKLAVTWQTGESALIAARLGVPVVSDFRPADMAAGGKGAPLVPYLDYRLYRSMRIGRIAQNIGGIANLTAIPPAAGPTEVVAFDTGPGNMVIDALTERLFGQRFDRDGKIAASGSVLPGVVAKILQRSFFACKPPRTAGREDFGREFAEEFLRLCKRAGKDGSPGQTRQKHNVVATATALTAYSIAKAVKRFVIPRGQFGELIVSGGGAKNSTLMTMLSTQLQTLGLRLRYSNEFGVPSEAKEAVAFALLAHETWNRRTSNLPSATGARKPAILGKISYA